MYANKKQALKLLNNFLKYLKLRNFNMKNFRKNLTIFIKKKLD